MDLWGRVCFSQWRAVLPLQGSLGPAFGHQNLGASQVRRWVTSPTSGVAPVPCQHSEFTVMGSDLTEFQGSKEHDCRARRDQPCWELQEGKSCRFLCTRHREAWRGHSYLMPGFGEGIARIAGSSTESGLIFLFLPWPYLH